MAPKNPKAPQKSEKRRKNGCRTGGSHADPLPGGSRFLIPEISLTGYHLILAISLSSISPYPISPYPKHLLIAETASS